MAENSKIEWCDHTFNPWIGCQRVSAGCDFCYAETLMDKRLGRVKWGAGEKRVRTSAANWAMPGRWDDRIDADPAGRRERVFCASLADVFDNAVPEEWRFDLWDVILTTPNLDWLLLTKRPENIAKMRPAGGWPENVWLGASAEDQDAYMRRWPHLEHEDVDCTFISYEPALGPLSLAPFAPSMPDWLICGGESGTGARPMHPDWARSIRDQCDDVGVPFFMKQMTKKATIPDDLLIREWPDAHART